MKLELEDIWPIQEWKVKPVEQSPVVVADVLLLAYTRICEPAFSGCFVWWNSESLICYFYPQEPC